MAKILLRAASRVYVSTDAWRRYLAPHMPAGRSQGSSRCRFRRRFRGAIAHLKSPRRRTQLLTSSSTRLVGHFGTFGSEVAPMLAAALTRLLNDDSRSAAVCVGSGSDEFVRSLAASSPAIGGRVQVPAVYRPPKRH